MAIDDAATAAASVPSYLSKHAIDASYFATRNPVLLYVPTGTGAQGSSDRIDRFLATNKASLAALDHHASTKVLNKQVTASAIIEEKSFFFFLSPLCDDRPI